MSHLVASEGAAFLQHNVADPDVQASLVQAMCKFLCARDRVFAQMVYSDPSWEIILLLHAARTEAADISFADLCRVLNASSETLTRCISLLEGNGLVLRRDTGSGDVLELSPRALDMIDQAFKLTSERQTPVWGNRRIES